MLNTPLISGSSREPPSLSSPSSIPESSLNISSRFKYDKSCFKSTFILDKFPSRCVNEIIPPTSKLTIPNESREPKISPVSGI